MQLINFYAINLSSEICKKNEWNSTAYKFSFIFSKNSSRHLNLKVYCNVFLFLAGNAGGKKQAAAAIIQELIA